MTLKDVYYNFFILTRWPAQALARRSEFLHTIRLLVRFTGSTKCRSSFRFFFERCKMRCFGSSSLFSKAPHRRSESFAPRPSLPWPIINENDDDGRVLSNFFATLDTNQDGKLSRKEIEDGLTCAETTDGSISCLNMSRTNENLSKAGKKFLEVFDEELKNFEDKSITLLHFKEIAEKVPRIKGQRLQWVKSFNLNGRLASLLNSGDIFDQMSGIRTMNETEMKMALRMFGEVVEDIVMDAWRKVTDMKRMDQGLNYTSQVIKEIDKFAGDLGKFGDEKMFQEGLEAQIGIPDPLILKGIFRENVLRPDSGNKRVSPNYKIVNSDKLEYARLLGNPSEYSKDSETLLTDSEMRDFDGIPIYLAEVALRKHSVEGQSGGHSETEKGRLVGGPSAAELKDLRPEFEKLKDLYKTICGQTNGIFPGDTGYTQKSLEIRLEGKSELPTLTALKDEIEEQLKAFNIEAAARVVVVESSETAMFSTVTVFWPIVSDDSRNFEAWLKHEFRKLEAGLKQFPVTYLYCEEAAELNREENLAELRELLMRLDDSQLLQICEGLGSAPSSKDERVKLIVADARKTGGITRPAIDFRQGRRRLSLRELMSVKEVRDAELRVEEAIQAYQYTGPLFEV